MQWWAVGEHNGRPALLVNVSRHGAMIVSPVLFEPGQVVRIFLEDAPTPLGVQGVVRGATEGVNGRHQVRLSFATACPDEFFEAAAHGFEAWLTGRGTHQGLS